MGAKAASQSPPLQRFEKGRIRKGTGPQKEPSSQAQSFPAGTRTWGLELGTLFFCIIVFCATVVLVWHLFIMFFFFLNNLRTKETPLIDPRGPQAVEQATSLSTALAHCWCNCLCSQEM